MQKIIDNGGVKNDLIKKKLNTMSAKVDDMKIRVKSIQETGRYLVKVADSCPLAIEQQRLQQ